MTLFFTSCSCNLWNQRGQHNHRCPMNPTCPVCLNTKRLCKIFGKCKRIPKKYQTFAEVGKARDDIKKNITNKFKDLFVMINFLINLGGVNAPSQEKIEALKATFNALCSKKLLDPETLNSAEKILLQLRRIYITQKVAYETKLKEDEKAALAECNADDFMPKHMDN